MKFANDNEMWGFQDKVCAKVKMILATIKFPPKKYIKIVSYDPRENRGSVLFTAEARGKDGRLFCQSKCDKIRGEMERKMKKTADALRKSGFTYVRVEKVTWDCKDFFGNVNFKATKEVA